MPPAPTRSGRNRRLAVLLLAGLAIVLLLSACAAGPNPATAEAERAGFWLGLWHGFIIPVTFVISLFTDNVNVYEVANTGNWYDFGFFLGAMVTLSGGSRATKRR